MCFAGVTYTVVTSTTQDGETYTMRVKTVVDGANARIEIVEGGAPPFTTGSWMLTRDGGRTFTVVDPGKKTYSTLTIKDSLNDVDALVEQQAKITNSTPEITRVSNEAGPGCFGLFHGPRTLPYDLRSYIQTCGFIYCACHARRRSLGRPSAQDRQRQRCSRALCRSPDGNRPARRIPQFRELGFPLKRITETRSESVDGTVERIVTTMEVKDVKEGTVEPSNFEIPAGYKKIERQPAND